VSSSFAADDSDSFCLLLQAALEMFGELVSTVKLSTIEKDFSPTFVDVNNISFPVVYSRENQCNHKRLNLI